MAEVALAQAMTAGLKEMGRILFKTFAVKKWLKLGLITLLMGFGSRFNLNIGNTKDLEKIQGSFPEAKEALGAVIIYFREHIAVAILLAIATFLIILGLILFFVWLRSVFSFIFLGSVIKNEVLIKRGFRENRARGRSFFLWNLAFSVISLIVLALVVGVPILIMGRYGTSAPGGGTNIPVVVFGIVAIVLGVLIVPILAVLIQTLVYDFILPIMYVENRRIIDGWQRFLPILKSNKKNLFLYLLLKIGLGIVALIGSIIVTIILSLVFLLIFAIIGLLIFLLAKAVGLSWNPLLITLAVTGGMLVIIGINYVYNCFLLPIPVFFRAYSLLFLGSCDDGLVTLRREAALPG